MMCECSVDGALGGLLTTVKSLEGAPAIHPRICSALGHEARGDSPQQTTGGPTTWCAEYGSSGQTRVRQRASLPRYQAACAGLSPLAASELPLVHLVLLAMVPLAGVASHRGSDNCFRHTAERIPGAARVAIEWHLSPSDGDASAGEDHQPPVAQGVQQRLREIHVADSH